MNRWTRFADTKVWHLQGPRWPQSGQSACGKIDLTHTGFELIDPNKPLPRNTRFCVACLDAQANPSLSR